MQPPCRRRRQLPARVLQRLNQVPLRVAQHVNEVPLRVAPHGNEVPPEGTWQVPETAPFPELSCFSYFDL